MENENLENKTEEEVTETIEIEPPITYTRVGQKKQQQPPKHRQIGVDDPKAEKKRIIIFLVVTFGLSWFMELVMMPSLLRSNDPALAAQGAKMVGTVMFMPAIGALAARILTSEGLLHSGFQFNFSQHKFCFLFGWFGTTALTFAGAALYFIIFRDNYDSQMTNFVRASIEGGATMDEANIIAAFKTTLLLNIFTAPLLDIMNSFGEEWGFRGYLLPKLFRKIGTIPAMLVTGLINGLWYAPLVMLGYFYGDEYPIKGILAMCVFVMVTNCLYSFICLRSGSIFPAIFAHSAVNVMMSQALLFTRDGGNPFIGPAPTGILAGIPFMITAVIFMIYMYRHPLKPNKTEENE